MVRRLGLFVAPLALLITAACFLPARAGDWPDRPVTVIVPFGPGGNTDTMARLAAQDLAAKFGQNFIIENRPSPGGAIGTRLVALAPPDGYTLMFAASSMITLTPQLEKLDFDPVKQLVPITNVGTGAQVIAIKRSLPATNLAEFLSYAKANPGKLNFTVAGTQNLSHFSPVLLFKRTGVDLVMVPARSEPAAISDLMGGVADLYFGNASALLPLINNDAIRLIAVSTPQRLPAAPDLPTISETVPGFESSSWNGFFAPTGTPEPIIDALRDEITAFVKKPDIAQRLTSLGIVPGGMTPEQTAALFQHDHDEFAAAIKAAGIPSSD
ncbi:MAG TPA: tripartite tricarboxylate transporter substrate binding protein [Xanthobacteraceae bacterium]|nr:tripartite tricarboxylate transporter substrate binding protein [Xanthobacteraceae bacterium]